MITGINHITFSVSDLTASIEFYQGVLGGEISKVWDQGAYIELGSIWICLSLDNQAAVQPRSDYTHVAFSISPQDFPEVEKRFSEQRVMTWKENSSEGRSIYFLDPDGHKLELHVGSLQTRLDHMRVNSEKLANPCGNAI